MGTQFLAEIRPFPFGFAPKGWALCAGQLLSINQFQALFSLIGTVYGGNGQNNFALPDLRSRVVIGANPSMGYILGARGGEEQHTLAVNELPSHLHQINVSNSGSGTGPTPSGTTVLGVTSATSPSTLSIYGTGAAPGSLAPATIGNQGLSQSHENRMPYGVISFCMAMQGIFPPRN